MSGRTLAATGPATTILGMARASLVVFGEVFLGAVFLGSVFPGAAFLGAALLAPAASAQALPPAPIALRADPVRIGPGALTRGVLAFVAGFELSSDDPRFGGLSGLALRPGGLVAVSDKGDYVEIDLDRDADDRIRRVLDARIGALRDAAGLALGGGSRDAEALARSGDGSFWVGFERGHRVAQYRALGGPAVAEASQLPVRGLGYNAGIEALAADRDGALIAIAEEPVDGAPETLSGWRMIGGRATAFAIDRIDGFAATGADFGPDGALYLLERRFSFFTGIHMRIRRFAPETMAALRAASPETPVALGAGETLGRLSGSDTIDNMEALVAEAAPDGTVLLTVVSDDNFSAAQRTLLLQFRAPPLR